MLNEQNFLNRIYRDIQKYLDEYPEYFEGIDRQNSFDVMNIILRKGLYKNYEKRNENDQIKHQPNRENR